MKIILRRSALVIFANILLILTTSMVFVSPVFASIITGGTNKNPIVLDNHYYDHSVFDDLKPSPLPASGKINYYAKGVMDQVWNYRHYFEKYIECSECVGFAALMRDGDKKRKICIQRAGSSVVEGPFHVIDVAKDDDKPNLIQKQNWLVDVDRNTSKAWKMQGPMDGKVLECSKDITPTLIDLNIAQLPTGTLLYNSRIRSGAGFTSPIVKVLPKGTNLVIYGKDITGMWYLVDKKLNLYVYSSIVRIND